MKQLTVILLIALSFESFANENPEQNPVYSHTGTINRLGAIPSRDNADYIIVNKFENAGNCPKSGGLAVARIPATESGNRAFSMALAAKIAGKQVTISVNEEETHPEDGNCFLRSLQIED